MSWLPKRDKLDSMRASAMDFAVAQEGNFYVKGCGKAFLKELARIAVERGCGWLERWCLDSTRPGVDFCPYLGAEPMVD